LRPHAQAPHATRCALCGLVRPCAPACERQVLRGGKVVLFRGSVIFYQLPVRYIGPVIYKEPSGAPGHPGEEKQPPIAATSCCHHCDRPVPAWSCYISRGHISSGDQSSAWRCSVGHRPRSRPRPMPHCLRSMPHVCHVVQPRSRQWQPFVLIKKELRIHAQVQIWISRQFACS
jgi:hypothetical protein